MYASLNSICGLSFHFIEDIYEIRLDAHGVPFASCQVGTLYSHDVIGDVSLDHLVKVSAGFLHCAGTIFLFPYTVILFKNNLCPSFPQNVLTVFLFYSM